MKKRPAGYFLLVALLSSCSSYSATPEVKDFLTGLSGPKAYASVSHLSVAETYRSLDSAKAELGKMVISYEMDKSNASSLYWHRINLYSGDQIVNNIVKAEYLLLSQADGYHTYILANDNKASLQDIPISDDKASSLVRDVIYTPQESYDSGGLYYGDIFKVNTSQFPNDAFALNEAKTTLTFQYSYENSVTTDSGGKETLDSDQTITINNKGLLTSSYELLRVVSSGKAGENILTPDYAKDVNKLTSL